MAGSTLGDHSARTKPAAVFPMNDYIELTKPRITWLILVSTGVGFFFGIDGGWEWMTLLHTILGTGLIASGTAALNQWWERDEDARMHRTRKRPLPSNRISPEGALWFAIGLSVTGFVELWYGANSLAAVLGLFTLITYLLIYTPLKKRTPHSTTIGAIPGAMPPVIGYAAARSELTLEALVLFAILFLWQFPHFYSIAWLYREDYSRAGIRMLPVVDPSGERTARQILFYALLLVPVSLVPRYLEMSGNLYLVGALLLGAMYFYYGFRIRRDRSAYGARRVLLASIVYLPLLYGLMLVDRPGL
jgi:protoheme IX farnesyltransferase